MCLIIAHGSFPAASLTACCASHARFFSASAVFTITAWPIICCPDSDSAA